MEYKQITTATTIPIVDLVTLIQAADASMGHARRAETFFAAGHARYGGACPAGLAECFVSRSGFGSSPY